MIKVLLENLKSDLDLIIKSNFHPRNLDLMNVVIKEEIPELIKFVEKVHNALNFEDEYPSGSYDKGYMDGLNQIKREIYD